MESPPPESTGRPAHTPGSMREILSVAIPLILSSGSISVMNAADRMLLAGFSSDALAASTPGSMLHWTAVCIPLGTLLYANTYISQFDGAGRIREMTAALWHAVWLAIAGGTLVALAAPLLAPIFVMAGHEPQVVVLENIYFRTLCYGSGLLLLSNSLSCYFSGRRRTQVVMWVNFISCLVNFVVGYVLIYGHFGMPELGIRGAAVSTLVARATDIVIYCCLIVRSANQHQHPLRTTFRLRRDLVIGYLKSGVPSGMHYFVDISGFLVFLMLVGTLSRDALAATNVAFSINGMIFVPLMGFGTAVQTLVGHHLGAGLLPAARTVTRKSALLGLIWTSSAALLLTCFPQQILAPFTWFAATDAPVMLEMESIRQTAAMLLQFVAVYSVFDALAVVYSSALRGAGDTLYPMLLMVLSTWCCMVVPAVLLVRTGQATTPRMWMAATAGIAMAGISMFLRYRLGGWERHHVLDDVTKPTPVPDHS